jgi:Flp pilus assembly protein TadG
MNILDSNWFFSLVLFCMAAMIGGVIGFTYGMTKGATMQKDADEQIFKTQLSELATKLQEVTDANASLVADQNECTEGFAECMEQSNTERKAFLRRLHLHGDKGVVCVDEGDAQDCWFGDEKQ